MGRASPAADWGRGFFRFFSPLPVPLLFLASPLARHVPCYCIFGTEFGKAVLAETYIKPGWCTHSAWWLVDVHSKPRTGQGSSDDKDYVIAQTSGSANVGDDAPRTDKKNRIPFLFFLSVGQASGSTGPARGTNANWLLHLAPRR